MSLIDFPQEGTAPNRLSRLAELREVLASKFHEPELRPASTLPTGMATIDAREGGLRKGAVTEIVGASSTSGLFIEAILARLKTQGLYAALIDAGCSFDPQGCDSAALKRLLWVMCPNSGQAIKAADLLLRDGNLPLILLDFHTVPLREMQRIPASTWHRFQHIVEPTGTAFVVLSRQPVAQGAKVRIAMREPWKLSAMRERRHDLLKRVQAQVFTRSEFSVTASLKQANG